MLEEVTPTNVPWDLLMLADPSRPQIEKYIHQARTFVLYRDASIVGVLVLVARQDTIEIMNIAVAPAFQGQGLGKLLLAEAKRIAKLTGAKSMRIGTGNSSLSQLALYQKAGFRIESIDRDFFVRNYDEPIIENGIVCRDMIRLSMEL